MKSLIYALAFIGLLTSCAKKEEAPAVYNIAVEKYILHFDEVSKLIASENGIDYLGKAVTWSSSDSTVAIVDANGMLRARKIGTVTVTASITGKFSTSTKPITVTPYSTLCKEPFFEDGASIAATKSKESRTVTSETASTLTFTGENAKLKNTIYLFKDGKLNGSVLIFTNTADVVAESDKFFAERYTYLGLKNNIYYYGNGKDLVVAVSSDSKIGFSAIYFKGDGISRSIAYQNVDQFTFLKEALLNL